MSRAPPLLSSFPLTSCGDMATKIQAKAAFLLFNLMFCTFASGQVLNLPLIKCLSQPRIADCGLLLRFVSLCPHSTLDPCCSFFTNLTSVQAIRCLCVTVNRSLLGPNISVPGDIVWILITCDKPVPPDLSCTWFPAAHSALEKSLLHRGPPFEASLLWFRCGQRFVFSPRQQCSVSCRLCGEGETLFASIRFPVQWVWICFPVLPLSKERGSFVDLSLANHPQSASITVHVDFLALKPLWQFLLVVLATKPQCYLFMSGSSMYAADVCRRFFHMLYFTLEEHL